MKTISYILTLAAIWIAFLASPQGVYAQADAIAQHFSRYMDQPEFTSIYISPRMFRLMAKLDNDQTEEELKRTLNTLGGLRILSADSVKGMQYYDEVMGVLSMNQYEELMRIKDDDGNLRFMVKENNQGKITELLMLTGAPNSFFMLSIIGNDIDLGMLGGLSEQMEIDGLKELKNLKDKPTKEKDKE